MERITICAIHIHRGTQKSDPFRGFSEEAAFLLEICLSKSICLADSIQSRLAAASTIDRSPAVYLC